MSLEEKFINELWVLINNGREEELHLSTKKRGDILNLLKEYYQAKLKILGITFVDNNILEAHNLKIEYFDYAMYQLRTTDGEFIFEGTENECHKQALGIIHSL